MELRETSLQLAGMALSRANIQPEQIDAALSSLRGAEHSKPGIPR